MMNVRLLTAAACLLALTATGPASAQPPYLDDRSSPEQLVRSLYNAINRQEYARAYSYFDPPPADSLEEYAEGFADTESVSVITGDATSEGAAGSIYYSIPVAISARQSDDTEQVFAGCYTLRFIQPSVQTTPYQPLSIEQAEMTPADGPIQSALPSDCGDGAPPDQDAQLTEEAVRIFTELYGNVCVGWGPQQMPESYAIEFNYPHDPQDAPKRQAQLYEFFCDSGAYNQLHAYLMANENGEIQPLRFATPELNIQYRDDDQSEVDEIRIIGYRAEDLLVNAQFDPQTLEIVTESKWRGVGDASSAGTWIFRSGAFTLVRYAVDASYDGKVNPELLLDYHSGP